MRPLVNRVTTRFFHARRRSRAIGGGPNTMQAVPMSAASSITLAACSSAFEGIQPTFKHTPPSIGQRSISVTLRPRSAALNAAVYPPTPAPSTTRSTAPGGGAAAGAGEAAAGGGEAAGAARGGTAGGAAAGGGAASPNSTVAGSAPADTSAPF